MTLATKTPPSVLFDPLQALAVLVELKSIKEEVEKAGVPISAPYISALHKEREEKAWETAREVLKQTVPHTSEEKVTLARRTFMEFVVPDDGSILDPWKKVVDVISASVLCSKWHTPDAHPPEGSPVAALCVYPNKHMAMQTVIWHSGMGQKGDFATVTIHKGGKHTTLDWCPYVRMWCYIPELPTVWPEPLRSQLKKDLGKT